MSPEPSARRSPPAGLVDWLLGAAEPRRSHCSLTLMALVVYVLFAGVQHGEVLLGLIDRTESHALSVFNLGGALLFYALVRSGVSARLVPQDPSLTLLQMVFAVVSISWSYAITGPARGAVMGILILVLMYGMFGLPPRAARGLALMAFATLSAVMAWRAATLPDRYPPRVEVVHALFALIVLGGTSTLAIRIGRLRARLAQQKKELREALAHNRELATRDALTGLLNRRAMVDVLAREHPRVQRERVPTAIALIDIDHFKRINDTLGHGAGDEVLRQFAAVLRSQLRGSDALARWGGEEFLLLMPGTPAEAAGPVLARLRDEVAAGPFAAIAPGLEVTFSAGLVELQPGESQDTAIDRADRALYRAKQSGRDRVECH